MCRLNYWLSRAVWVVLWCHCRVLCAIVFDNYLRVRMQFVQRVSSFLRMNVSWMRRVNYWLSCCLDCFCCVIVVCCAKFICDNYLRVRIQFVQRVSSFSRKKILEICRIHYWFWTVLLCHRRVLCAIHFWQLSAIRMQHVRMLWICFFCRFKYFLDALVATIRVGRTQRVSVVRLNSFLV